MRVMRVIFNATALWINGIEKMNLKRSCSNMTLMTLMTPPRATKPSGFCSIFEHMFDTMKAWDQIGVIQGLFTEK